MKVVRRYERTLKELKEEKKQFNQELKDRSEAASKLIAEKHSDLVYKID